MHVRHDNQYKIGADRENILGQPMLFVSESSRDCVSEEVSGVLSVPNKPSGFCGRKAVFTTTTTVCVRGYLRFEPGA